MSPCFLNKSRRLNSPLWPSPQDSSCTGFSLVLSLAPSCPRAFAYTALCLTHSHFLTVNSYLTAFSSTALSPWFWVSSNRPWEPHEGTHISRNWKILTDLDSCNYLLYVYKCPETSGRNTATWSEWLLLGWGKEGNSHITLLDQFLSWDKNSDEVFLGGVRLKLNETKQEGGEGKQRSGIFPAILTSPTPRFVPST